MRAVRTEGGAALSTLAGALRNGIAALAGRPEISCAIVSIADVEPGGARWIRPGEAQEEPGYQAVIELTACNDAFAEVVYAAMAAVRRHGSTLHAWQVTHLPARTEAERPQPGCTFHPALPDSAARRSWDRHVPLALRRRPHRA